MNHSRSTFSGTETQLFPTLMNFSNVKSGAESRSSGSSSSNNDDGHDAYGDNVDDNDVVFETEDLNTKQDTPPVSPNHNRIPTPIHRSPPHSHDEVIPSWAITLQSKNESLHKAVVVQTSLVSSLSTTVQSQDKEVLKLKKENKRLKLAKSSSKPKKFKRLTGGEGSDDEEIFGGDDVGPNSQFSNKVEANTVDAGPSSPFGDNIVSPPGSLITNVDKGQQIATEAEPQDELEAIAQADAETAKAAADSLSSILSQQLEKNTESIRERLNAPRTFARVYLRRKLPKDVLAETPLVILSKDST
ncbi:hypothetical protein L1987_27540 [Smallanthus sonchifolius]|uniref:Uncharacterized protein n=1 Tax=Smallanthus sonchifolius TaxID=185202 RepID=A0ACB9ICR8_9ASTR|nr:hypothetical protein L1987_27540 [Smallanthus sonchifolius]